MIQAAIHTLWWVCRATTVVTSTYVAEQAVFVAISAEMQIAQLQADTGVLQASWRAGRHAITAAAAASANSRFLLTGALVALYGAEEQRRLFKFSGHTVRHLLMRRHGPMSPIASLLRPPLPCLMREIYADGGTVCSNDCRRSVCSISGVWQQPCFSLGRERGASEESLARSRRAPGGHTACAVLP